MRSITVTTETPIVFASGDSVILTPITIAAIPGSGGTLLVEYQVVEDGSWFEWPDGTVDTAVANVLDGPVYALRFTAAVANGIVEIN